MNPPISQYEPALTWDILRFEKESHHYDRKSARLAPKELARHMSAFANADGGVIALGIEDAGEVTGLESRDGAENEFIKRLQRIWNMCRNIILSCFHICMILRDI